MCRQNLWVLNCQTLDTPPSRSEEVCSSCSLPPPRSAAPSLRDMMREDEAAALGIGLAIISIIIVLVGFIIISVLSSAGHFVSVTCTAAPAAGTMAWTNFRSSIAQHSARIMWFLLELKGVLFLQLVVAAAVAWSCCAIKFCSEHAFPGRPWKGLPEMLLVESLPLVIAAIPTMGVLVEFVILVWNFTTGPSCGCSSWEWSSQQESLSSDINAEWLALKTEVPFVFLDDGICIFRQFTLFLVALLMLLSTSFAVLYFLRVAFGVSKHAVSFRYWLGVRIVQGDWSFAWNLC